MVALLMVSD